MSFRLWLASQIAGFDVAPVPDLQKRLAEHRQEIRDVEGRLNYVLAKEGHIDWDDLDAEEQAAAREAGKELSL